LWPGITLTVLVWFFAAYLLVDGVFAVLAGLRAAEAHERWWPLAIEGALDLLAGAIALLWPALALLTFIYIAAFWAILTGLVMVMAVLRRRSARGMRFLLAGGVLSLAWGIVVIVWPIAGELVLAWWIKPMPFSSACSCFPLGSSCAAASTLPTRTDGRLRRGRSLPGAEAAVGDR
jgi:uncharacterized membrane protein HdeD (DUF308 family)